MSNQPKDEDELWLRALLGADREEDDPSVVRSAQLLRQAALRAISREAAEGERALASIEAASETHAFRSDGDGSGFFEMVELLAAAEPGAKRLPRMTTRSGFAISPIYRLGAGADEPPVSLLVECPESSRATVYGQTAFLLLGDQRIELGRFDIDGKATGPIPPGTELKPPFGFLVDTLEEEVPTDNGPASP